MSEYKPKHLSDLKEIINLIESGEEEEALNKFKLHISEVKLLGKFSLENWKQSWRSEVYNLGTKFNSTNPIDFLNCLKEEKQKSNKDEREVLDFYSSEIQYNTLPKEDQVSKIKNLIEEYPYNPEFRHNYAHSLHNNGKYKEAIETYLYALKKDKHNKHFEKSLFHSYIPLLSNLLKDSKYDEGIDLIKDILKGETFIGEPIYHNYFISFNERFQDQILFSNKIKEAENSINEIIKTETQKGQNRIIEILGFFSAIMAFIFSTISIGKNFNFSEAIIFNISLGLILLMFVLVIHLLFSNKKIKFWDYRIGLTIIIILSLLLIITEFGIPIWLK
ncbi:tetratricopeptide repeat protein [Pseudotenacibaculum haliotis]|uniref:Tetratricopeptide repeat protein n=1 Tax=Pseudotenacibaculum haliotis TaxID=1862138 RepID=A0ABW5LXY6_9FLAO